MTTTEIQNPANIGRSVEHVRTGESGEFAGGSALDAAVIHVATTGAPFAAQADDWRLVY